MVRKKSGWSRLDDGRRRRRTAMVYNAKVRKEEVSSVQLALGIKR